MLPARVRRSIRPIGATGFQTPRWGSNGTTTGGRFADLSTGLRPRLQISRPLWGLCAAPSSHHHSLFGVPCSIFAVPFAVSAPTGRRIVATGGAARSLRDPTRNPWKADDGKGSRQFRQFRSVPVTYTVTPRCWSRAWPAGGLQASRAIFHVGVPVPTGVRRFRPNGAAECSRGWSGAVPQGPDAEPVESG